MKIAPRFSAVAMIVILGIPTVAAWVISRTPETENPPCQACSSLYSSTEIDSGDVCNLPLRFSVPGGMIRINATFRNDAAYTTLSGKGCKRAVPVGMDRALGACAETQKMLAMHSGLGSWYDGEASVTVVGYTGIINNPKSYHYGEEGFNIVCLEHVEPIGSTLRERSSYVLGRLLDAM